MLTQSKAMQNPHCTSQRPSSHDTRSPLAPLLFFPKTAKSSSNGNVQTLPWAGPIRSREPRDVWSLLSGANWIAQSFSHREWIDIEEALTKIRSSSSLLISQHHLSRRGLMWISLFHLCFLFSWHSLIVHNAGNSMSGQNSLKLSNELQWPVYLVFQLAFPPRTFHAISKVRLKLGVSNSHPTLTSPCISPQLTPTPSSCSSSRPSRFL